MQIARWLDVGWALGDRWRWLRGGRVLAGCRLPVRAQCAGRASAARLGAGRAQKPNPDATLFFNAF
eukprot:6176245-Lingulodinium_polyedra.AAC.1